MAELELKRDGAQLYAGAASPFLDRLLSMLALFDHGAPGHRIQRDAALGDLIVSADVAGLTGDGFHPVRAVLFDKNPGNNWALGWHQDRTICVKDRREVPGFGPWSTKQGLIRVEPPFALIEAMVTIRIHLDPVRADNAPLLIAPGSHRLGRIPVNQIEAVVQECGVRKCLAEPSDIWVYSTPIVHASERSASPARRRVLQIDFSRDHLLGGLEWTGL